MEAMEQVDSIWLEIIFLDNFQETLSDYKLESEKRVLDYVPDVVSEDEKAPLVIISGEKISFR